MWCFRAFSAILFSWIFLFPVFGQEATISGRVCESTTGEPMQFATVALFNMADTNITVAGTTTDNEGRFNFRDINPGNYFVEVSFIGFKNARTPLFYHEQSTDLGTLELVATEILLDDVTISGKQDVFTHAIDKKVYQVEQDILSESGNATEILQNIPSVSVDVNGNVSLRGSSNILFLVNGRPSALLRRSAASALQQIPAATIERFEVITNPSAKYKPDGTGGIINIILKKETQQGINGQLTVNAGNEKRYNGNLMLNYGTEDLNLFANYSIRHSNRSVFYTDQRTNRDPSGTEILSFYTEDGNSTNNSLSHVVSAGANYQINDFNSVELSGTWFYQNTQHSGVSEIGTDYAASLPITRLTSNQTNDEYEHEGEAAMVWEHAFKDDEDHTFTFESTYASYDEEEDQMFDEEQTFPEEGHTIDKVLIQKSGNQTEITAEYLKPLSEDAEFEAGYVGEFINEDIRYTNNDSPNRFLLAQNVHALYALCGMEAGDFSFKAGLRGEQTYLTSKLTEPSDSTVQNNYFKPYPTIHLLYNLTENRQLGLSYSKRINRPDADELNPNPEFSDPRNAEAGNPNLKPEQIHSLELSLHGEVEKYTFTPTLYYRYTYDAFTSIKTIISDSIILKTIQNLDSRQLAGLELILTGNPYKNLSFNLSANVFYDQIDAANLGYSDKKSVFSTDVKFYALLNFTTSTILQLNAYYYSPRITPQGQRDQYYYMNVGLKQQLFRNRAAITFTVTDVFHTYKINRETDIPELLQNTSYHRKGAVVYLGFTWFFKAQNNGDERELKFEGEGL